MHTCTTSNAADMKYLFDIRHVITHNFGAVSLKFKEEHPIYPADIGNLFDIDHVITRRFGAGALKFKEDYSDYPAGVGNLLMLDFDLVKKVSFWLANHVCDIDTRAVARFHLPHLTVRHPGVTSGSDPGAAKMLPLAVGGVWSSTCFSADVAEDLPIGASIGFPWTRHTPLCRRCQK